MIALAKSITESALFKRLIVGVILLAGVIAGVETSESMVQKHRGLLKGIDTVILAIFTAEIVLKLVANGRRPQLFFKDPWNVFDCVIVGLCLLPAAGPFAAVIRLARILRVLRLVTAIPRLQLLVTALLKSLSAMGYVSLLLGLLFYIYAVTGIHLFGKGSASDFATLPSALLTLFQVVTLDNWGDIFDRAAATASGLVTSVYFVSFIVFGTMIILNLFIGIIMNSMAEAQKEQETILDSSSPSAAELVSRLNRITRELGELQNSLNQFNTRIAEFGAGQAKPCPLNQSSIETPMRSQMTPAEMR